MLGRQWWDSQPGCPPTIRDRNIGKNRRRPTITLGEDVSGTGWSSTVQRFTQAGLPMRLPVAAIAPAEAGGPMLASGTAWHAATAPASLAPGRRTVRYSCHSIVRATTVLGRSSVHPRKQTGRRGDLS